MSTALKNRVGIVFACLLLVGAGICLSPTHPLTAAPQVAKDSPLKELRKAKLAIAQEFATSIRAAYDAGERNFERLWKANRTLHDAELDLCETNAERMAVLEKMLSAAREQEQSTVKLVEQGLRVGTDVMQAKLNRLDAEIALEQAKEQ
ncbi:MAG: hypothetical protein U0992_23130 [Planctomycetaceae bacterium]